MEIKREVIVKGISESKRNWIEGMVLVHLVILVKEIFIHESMDLSRKFGGKTLWKTQ